MRKVLGLLCLFTLAIGPCSAGDFVPPEEKDPPVLTENLTEEKILPLGITSSAVAAAGITLTAAGFYNIYNNLENGFQSPVLQAGIIMTAGGTILTAVAAIVFDYIFNKTDLAD